MLKVARWAFLAGVAVNVAFAQSAHSADLGDVRAVRHASHSRVYKIEDECGCMHYTFVYHRERRFTYGWDMDPRSFDMTEPYFYRGPVRRYVRFW